MTFLPTLKVEFDKPLRAWDGFGVNYVEACQTRDYTTNPQEYGGFSCLSEDQRQEVIALIFGEDGLKPSLIKMFLDPFHQPFPTADYDYHPDVLNADSYDHATSTQWMRYFVREGLKHTRARGADLSILTTLYGPPAWMTQQKIVRGRDLDPNLKTEVAKYTIAWVKWLRDVEGFPVKYISLHNEGEDWIRWPLDGQGDGELRHDYNLYWPPEQVADFLAFMPHMLKGHGLADVALTPGEATGWGRFHTWGYADAIADNPESLQGLGLITSHGFFVGDQRSEWFNDWRSNGTDILQALRPDLHVWVTSTSWSKMDVFFVNEIHNNIYAAKVNAIIPWAAVQCRNRWYDGDPNAGTAIKISEDGHYDIFNGYYYYKQVSRAGQAGMSVCRVSANDRMARLIAFGANGTQNPDAFVLLNLWDHPQEYTIKVSGTTHTQFEAYRTDPTMHYAPLGTVTLDTARQLRVTAPPFSVTTFFAV